MDIHITRSMRKSIALQVKNSQLIVKAPFFVTKNYIMDFIDKHKNWIETRMSQQWKSLIDLNKIDEYKEQAKEYIPNRVKIIADEYWYEYNTIKITSAKTRWWSCTSKKNLNFSFRLILTPKEIIDYVICHELSHLRQMNHSRQFWEEVSIMDIEYKKHDKWLKDNWYLYVY
jgi:predicted metal-dependent hydrolase